MGTLARASLRLLNKASMCSMEMHSTERELPFVERNYCKAVRVSGFALSIVYCLCPFPNAVTLDSTPRTSQKRYVVKTAVDKDEEI